MFDTYIAQRPRTEYVDRNINITEHRAPTDASVKLLREMEAKAEASRIALIPLPAGNAVTGVVEVMQRHDRFNYYQARVIFEINGRRCTAEIGEYLDNRDGPPMLQIMPKLRDELARVLAGEIIGDLLTSVRL